MTAVADTGTDHAEDSTLDTDNAADDLTVDVTTDTTERRRGPLPAIALLALAAALVATGVVFLARAASLGDSGAAGNDALVDRPATTEVISQVSTALNQVLSYDYRKPAAAQAAAKKYLVGDAPAQYRVLFAQLQKLAPGQQLTLVAKVSTAGVTSLRGDTAQLLVFLDQQSTRASDGQSSVAAAQVQITAVRSGDTYKISELKPL